MPSSNGNGDITLTVGLNTKDARKQAKQLSDIIDDALSRTSDTEDSKVQTINRQLKEAQLKTNKLRAEMDKFATTRIYSDDYKAIENEIDSLGKKLASVSAQKQRFLDLGKSTNSPAFKAMQYDIDNIKSRTKELNAELRTMVQEGTAFKLGIDTPQFEQLNAQLGSALDKEKVLILKQSELTGEVYNTGEAEQHHLNFLQQGWQNIMEQHKAWVENRKAIKDNISWVERLRDTVSKVTSGIISALKKIPGHMKSLKKDTNHIFKNILKWGFGIRSMFILVRKLRTAIKEGFQNFMEAEPNSPLTKQLNDLKATLSQLKNSFAIAFAPIVSAAIPYIKQLVSWLTSAINAMAQFIAALTGAKTYTRALKGATGATDANTKATKKNNKAKEEQNKQLGKFDELNVINQDKQKDDEDEDTGKGGAGGGVGFETLPVEQKFKDLIDKLKEMWKNADFTELGKELGEKLKKSLDSIDWDTIKKIAYKIGKSIATLINGFVEVPDLGTSIGKTVAEGLNTVLAVVQGFLDNFHAMATGNFLGEIINGFVQNADWEGIGKAISDFISECIELLSQFILTTDFGDILDAIGKMIAGIDWKRIAGDLAMADMALLKLMSDLFFGLISSVSIVIADLFRELGLNSIAGFWEGIAQKAQEARTKVKEFFQNLVNNIKEFLGIHSPSTVFADIGRNIVLGLIQGIQSVIGQIKQIFTTLWNNVKTICINAWTNIQSAVVNRVNTLKNSLTNIGNNIKTSWTNIWNNIKNTITNIATNMVNSIKQKLQGLLDAFNTLRNGWNDLKNSVGSGIETVRTSVSSVRIPGHATGQVIPPSASEYLAVLGDNNKETEVVSPLSTMREAMLEALKDSGLANGGGTSDTADIVINIDGNEIMRVVRKQNNIYKKATGRSAFA